MVAENDTALGRVVEAISRSRVWNESAIFVLEDDAQNGPDHVDAHRSPALVVSPFTKRRVVDSTLYTTSAMLRTMELILGLEPMSQYDAAATPMYNAFQPTPVLTPFTALPARVPLDELELNEIIWRSVRGPDSPMPPPRRAAFIRPVDADEAEEHEDHGDDDDNREREHQRDDKDKRAVKKDTPRDPR
jgi:hypothetical protein